MKVKTNQFDLNQTQKTKAYFHVEFKLGVDVQTSHCTGVNTIAFPG